MDLRRYLQASAEAREAFVAEVATRLPSRFRLNWRPAADLLARFLDVRNGLTFLLIPSGEFRMGLSEDEERAALKISSPIPANLWEMRPTRFVAVSTFLMSEAPVLNDLACSVLGSRSSFGKAKRPAFLTHEEALRLAASQDCRLPWEREWEYACRAGTRSLFVFGDALPPDDELGQWLSSDYSEVSRILSNPFGLRGMYAGEWCQDEFRETLDANALVVEGSYVVRGGGAYFWPWQDDEWVWCMSAMRMPSKDLADGTCGLRLVHDVVAPAVPPKV